MLKKKDSILFTKIIKLPSVRNFNKNNKNVKKNILC